MLFGCHKFREIKNPILGNWFHGKNPLCLHVSVKHSQNPLRLHVNIMKKNLKLYFHHIVFPQLYFHYDSMKIVFPQFYFHFIVFPQLYFHYIVFPFISLCLHGIFSNMHVNYIIFFKIAMILLWWMKKLIQYYLSLLL